MGRTRLKPYSLNVTDVVTPQQQQAADLLRSLDVSRPPVPVERIARWLGAQLAYEPFEGELSGLLHRQADKAVIGVNDLHPKTRQRFTIAHEIGHLRLHPGKPFVLDRTIKANLRDELASTATDREEIEANAFAAELLMPVRMVLLAVRSIVGDAPHLTADDLVRNLAPRFIVSQQAMRFRLINLGIVDAA